LGLRGIINPAIFLPPLDRSMTLISLVLLVWLWAFPEPSRAADSATLLLTLLIGTVFVFALLTWGQQPSGTPYNTTLQEFFWQLVSVGFIAFGGFIIFVRKPNGWNNGISVLMLAFLGHSIHLAVGRMDGNYPGLVRLAYMAIYPFLFTLPQRFPLPVVQGQPPTKVTKEVEVDEELPEEEEKPFGTDPKTFHALLDLAAQTNAEKVSHAITRGVAQTLLADLCFLMYLTDSKKQLVIASGYDLIREENLEGTSLGKNSAPMLTNAIQRGRPLRLPASSTSADIRGLGELLGLRNPGHVMSVPIVTPEKEPLGGLLVLSPYSDRAWRAEDQAYLKNISNALVPILRRSQRVSALEQKQQESERALMNANQKVEELQAQILDLQNQVAGSEALPDRIQADSIKELENQLVSMKALHQEAQNQVVHLQAENEALRSETGEKGPGGKPEKSKLRAALEEIAQLRDDLKEARAEAGGGNGKAPPDLEGSADQHEVIVSISQELRQPLSSVVGYTDLLLGESVGILGTLQRKFVERIKSSTARIGSLIDDLIQVTSLDAGPMRLTLEPVDLNTIIDSAMSYTSSQIREKNITLHLDLPKEIQPIHADREALQQILIHLLQNAGAASPSEGTITLKVQTRSEKDQQYILLQVTDTGGGIPSEDLQRVFTRLYRANNVLIQGVGDTGVGLSIAKTLTEAQNGRIWVESEAGVGATFSVLLPVSQGE
jgi:signal transduction histidine kinase